MIVLPWYVVAAWFAGYLILLGLLVKATHR